MTMFTAGEYTAVRVCAVYQTGEVLPPCGACREFLRQMGERALDIELLLDNAGRTKRLRELLPDL